MTFLIPLLTMEPTEKPKRNRLPSARVTDKANDGEFQLTSHRRARNDAQQYGDDVQSHVTDSTTTNPAKRKHPDASTSAETGDDVQSHVTDSTTTANPAKRKHPNASTSAETASTSDSVAADRVPLPQSGPNQAEGECRFVDQKHILTTCPTGSSGFKRARPATPSESSGDENSKTTTAPKNRSLDVDAFFKAAEKGHDRKPRRKCKLCL